jgi:hypothetical protein
VPASRWSQALSSHGRTFLAWLEENDILKMRGTLLSQALAEALRGAVHTREQASAVWAATQPALRKLNDPSTYNQPLAPVAYAWLHFLERYARTWRALEVLVRAKCLPLARYGVRALDIGAGPGPAAFAIHDFYQALVTFSKERQVDDLDQPSLVTCVERDPATNSLRHNIAEMVNLKERDNPRQSIFSVCGGIPEFGTLDPPRERLHRFQSMADAEERYFDPRTGEWEYDLIYSRTEANDAAQALHRYRLFVFSNFLTEVDLVTKFESTLMTLFKDAHPGAVILVLGGREGEYPAIYTAVDQLAHEAGFRRQIWDQKVAASETSLGGTITQGKMAFLDHLEMLCPELTSAVPKRFKSARLPRRPTWVRAYRKTRQWARRSHTKTASSGVTE